MTSVWYYPQGEESQCVRWYRCGKNDVGELLNHHRPPQGSVLLGERDITSFSRSGYVVTSKRSPKIHTCFQRLLKRIFVFGSADARLARRNQVDEVLELSVSRWCDTRFEQGDQTLVSEKGIMLSGGKNSAWALLVLYCNQPISSLWITFCLPLTTRQRKM